MGMQGISMEGVWREFTMTLRCQAVEQVRFSRMGKAQKPLVASVVSFLSVSGICLPPREFARASGEMPIPERLGWRTKPGPDLNMKGS